MTATAKLTKFCTTIALIAALDWPGGRAAHAQPPVVRPYDGIQAGLDAFRLAEEQRQAQIGGQAAINDGMRFLNGYSSRGGPIYYGYLPPQAIAAYGFGFPVTGYPGGWSEWPFDGGYAYGSGPLRSGYGSPLASGRVWGYTANYPAVRQPVGQQQTQTGPNRWESHPVYDPPLAPFQPTPPVVSALLDRTPYANVFAPATGEWILPPAPAAETMLEPTTPPAASPRRGPREY
jgi:hypothetical protein